ncbi:hypothetical protein MSAN_02047400 [Mycena sanguinolenta]|uniref:Uncharacterized protein n=1 Tax=Mycena sanguinolenta TaxID=230812 RepID=A0A8H6XKC3_9AGAR|nr:hypothetical protein MSAN_02047400 [Mycena sanguinolenta]
MTPPKPTPANSAKETTPLHFSPNGTTRSTNREEFGSDTTDYYASPSQISSITPNTLQMEHRSPSKLSSIVRSLLFFQFAIIVVHLLSCITPIIDIVSTRSQPAPLGTQHVALLLAGWAPVAIFAPLSAVRSQLAFWR